MFRQGVHMFRNGCSYIFGRVFICSVIMFTCFGRMFTYFVFGVHIWAKYAQVKLLGG